MEYKSKKWLIESLKKYGNFNNLAEQTGYPKTSIRRYAKKYGIENLSNPRKHFDKKPNVLYNDKDWLIEQLNIHGSGKKIAETHSIAVTSVNRWIRKYKLEDERNIGQSSRIRTLDEKFFSNINTEEKAYWLGFIVADGCIYHNKTSYDITFTVGLIDKDHMRKMQTSLKNDNEITESLGTKGNIDVHYRFSSKRMFTDLQKLGVVQRKTGKESIPNIPNELVRHFIRGYFDGDGSTYGLKEYNLIGFNICCANKGFLEDIKNHLEDNTSIKMNPVRTNGKNNFFLDLKNRNKCHRIYSYLYTNCSFYLDRKKSTIHQFLNSYSPPKE